MTLRLVVLALALSVCSSQQSADDKFSSVQQKTAELMGQVLAAVSTSSRDDSAALQKLCTLINSIESDVHQLNAQEVSDSEYAMAHLRAELAATKANLTAIRIQFNSTAAMLKAHQDAVNPAQQQLASAKAREAALLKQKQMLQKECEQDMQGHQFRTDSVKSDMSVLESALTHLQSLRTIASPNSQVSLLEVDEAIAEPKCTDPTITGPIVRCQNGYYVPIVESNGTISTFPPGNGMLYTRSLKCGFKISPSAAGILDRLELNFLAINTLTSADYVEVYDGPQVDEDRLLARFSGRVASPPTLRTKSPQATIMFVSQGGQNMDSFGFVTTYKTLRVPVIRNSAVNLCPVSQSMPLVLTGQAGFIAEDARPEFAEPLAGGVGTVYAKAPHCSWLVRVQDGQIVRLHFTFLNTEAERDFVSVYDGEDESALRIAQLSGSTTPPDVYSSSNFVYITYHADYTVSGFGFHLAWAVNGTQISSDNSTDQLPNVPPLPDTPVPVYNVTAQIPPTIGPAVAAVQPPMYVIPPSYPQQTNQDQSGQCCLNACSGHGMCDVITCACACQQFYTGTDCSQLVANLGDNVLMELDSGSVDDASGALVTTALIEDSCGDDVQLINPQTVAPLNLDPVTNLLERLKFELFRSLTYEHDTSNSTKKSCARELRQQDQDLQQLQQEVLMLNKNLNDMDAQTNALMEKKASLITAMSSYESYGNELTARIQNINSQTDSRHSAQQQEITTLQSMRDLITQISGQQCTLDTPPTIVFNEFAGVECYGELLNTQLQTDDPTNCQKLCAFGCTGFTYNSHQGCRFFSSIRDHTTSCSGGPGVATCSCFEKQ